jgi:CRP-like cAMP-binding protein
MKSVEKIYERGKNIIKKGDEINSVYVVVSGSVKEQYDDFYFIRGLGNILNPYDFTYNEPSKSTIKAKTHTKIMEVQGEIIL